MKRNSFVIILSVIVIPLLIYSFRYYLLSTDMVFVLNENKPVPEESIELAHKAMDLAGQGDFETMQDYCDDNMKTYYPASRSRKLWELNTLGTGAYKRKISLKASKCGTMDEIFIQCEFEKCTTAYRILVNDKQQIAAFEPNSYYYFAELHSK